MSTVKTNFLKSIFLLLSFSTLNAGIGDFITGSSNYSQVNNYNSTYNSNYSNPYQMQNTLRNTPQAQGVVGKVTNSLSTVNQIQSQAKALDGIANTVFTGLGMSGSFFIQPIKIPGLIGLNLECDLPDNGSGRSLDVCSDIIGGIEDGVIGGFNSIAKLLGKGISLGGCKVSVDTRKICKTDILEDSCNAIRSAGKSVAKGLKDASVQLTPVQSIVASVEEIARFGEDMTKEYMKDMVDSNNCLAILPKERRKNIPVGNKGKKLAELYRDNFSANNLMSKGVRQSGGDSIYSPELYTWRECIMVNPDNPEVCDAERFVLPKTYEDVQNEIDKTRLAMSDGMERSRVFDNSIVLANNYIMKCKEGETQYACEERIYKDGYEVIDASGKTSIVKPSEMKQKQYEDANRGIAAFSSVSKALRNEKSYLGFMTEDVAQQVAIQDRKKFRHKALINMKKEAMYDYSLDRILQLKKEIIDIEHNLVKVSASQFNAKEAKQEVDAIIAAFSTSETSGSSTNTGGLNP